MAKNLGVYIKGLRESGGFSQDFVAQKIGVSRPTFVQIEKGERELSVSEAERLAGLFGISLVDFLSEKEPDKHKVILEKMKEEKREPGKRISVPQKKLGKFKEVLLYVLGKVGAKPNIGQTALYKLLYFIDFDFYEKFEEQLIGATYIKNSFGPTPIEFKKIVEDMEKKGELEETRSKYFQYEQTKYLPHRSADLSKLSALEIIHIDEVLEKHSNKTGKELSNYSHGDVPWITAAEGKPIDYESVFYRTAPYSVRAYEGDEV